MIILALHQRNWKFGGLLKNLMTFSYYLRLRELKQKMIFFGGEQGQ